MTDVCVEIEHSIIPEKKRFIDNTTSPGKIELGSNSNFSPRFAQLVKIAGFPILRDDPIAR